MREALILDGVPLSDKEIIRFRDMLSERTATRASGLAAEFSDGKITLPQFQERLFTLTKNTTIGQYALGRGGEAALTTADRTEIARILGTQAEALRGFVTDIGDKASPLTAEQVADRASLYPSEAGIEAHSRGAAAAHGVDLAVSPPAHVNCRCEISWEGEGDTLTWSWQAQADACPICVDLASQYSQVAA